MGIEKISVVSDAGPLIHLAEIDCLPLLGIFENISIPETIWCETVEQGRILATEMMKLNQIQKQALSQADVSQFIQQNNLTKLHAGERDCLYLCQQFNISTLLTDDLAARNAAKALNLTPIGSLGIVAKAYQMGPISLAEAERHLLELYEVSSLFVTKAIVELAIEQLHNYAKSASYH